MHRFAQNTPCFLISPGLPISVNVIDGKIVTRGSHFSSGSKFTSEKIGNLYFLKYEGNYVSFVNNNLVVVDEIFTLGDLVYIEPYFNAIFHLKYKNDCLNISMDNLVCECPIKLQWASFDAFQLYSELESCLDEYDFMSPYQCEYVSVDGINLLNNRKSFFLIANGNFNKRLNYNENEYGFQFCDISYNGRTELKFSEIDGEISIYSEEFGYLQIGYEEDNQVFCPAFSRNHFEFPITLERARHFTTYYLKYEYCYIQLIEREGVTCGTLTNDKDEASVFQAISDYLPEYF
ncbi:hypothetical protein CONCODRAFT_71686 [Conidiobolus coronatus NRRL 28638]|uniref:Uncharacterized protein n=1 Tax=Conidiobolus coronatus (strain ATCC 28846 / CBS 209.66 / NRRL 28638) TaxID=796925 RepID=A0A137P2H3_CONC2|nr:hypothetical protein CONCODRAFT_71686 [Conidiobolus coronatus NRRL 28638]|eukprot:KXN69158.1 hypothetical protein CONCODRAFT_71686 [Conidiobolus coronatus NRRL 28638]